MERKLTRGPRFGVGTQRALRDILMPRGKNWLPTVSRQFLTLNYPRPNCLFKCFPNCLSPTREDIFSLLQNCPRGEGNCAAIERQKLSRGNFCLAASRCLSGPSGQKGVSPICSDLRSLFSSDLFPFAFLFCGNTPISSDLFRFAPISSDLFRFVCRTIQNKSGKPLSADPFCKSPINIVFSLSAHAIWISACLRSSSAPGFRHRTHIWNHMEDI